VADAHRLSIIAEKSFTPTTTWQVSWQPRSNGTGFWQLTELSGRPFARERTDWPVIYEDGRVAYDQPEQIPVRVREWCNHALWPYRSMSFSERTTAAAEAHASRTART